MNEVAPGLRYWTSPHPEWNGATDWPELVGCVYYEAADALVLIDPLLRRGSEEAFLAALDRDVARVDRPVAVLLTAPWHKRDAALVAERYGTTVWAHPAGQARLPFKAQAGPLPDGVDTFAAAGVREGDVAFYLRPRRALVVAEFFMASTEDSVSAPHRRLETERRSNDHFSCCCAGRSTTFSSRTERPCSATAVDRSRKR